MKVIWCWRCKRDIPMLEPDEAERVGAAYGNGLTTFDWSLLEQIYDETGDRHEVDRRLAFEQEYGGMLREYERITGFPETHPMALYHHRVEKYGPPCSSCGKPLRTPQARLCGSCMKPVSG